MPDFYKDEKYRVIKRRNPNILKVFYSIVYGASSETKKNIDILIDYLKIKESSKILIIGGGTEGHSIDKLLENNKSSITSIDIYPSDKTDYICDAHFLPFKNKLF